MSEPVTSLFERLNRQPPQKKIEAETSTPSESEPVINAEPLSESKPPFVLKPVAKTEPVTKPEPGSIPKAQPVQKTPGTDSEPVTKSEGVTGFTSFNNYVLDKVLRTLRPVEQSTLLRLLRLSHGFGKSFCKVSIPALASAVNTGETQIRAALKKLETLNYIERGEVDFSSADRQKRGATFIVNLEMPRPVKLTPSESKPVAKSEPIKDKDLKETNLNGAKQVEEEKAEKIETYEAEPLSDESRQAVLATMREYIKKGQKDFVLSQRDSYTVEDWQFLVSELEK